MKTLTAATLILALSAAPAWAQSRSVVVELFTSQGCSSCPPADAFLGEIAGRADVIALAFHVDYWDYIGWKDPFASPEFTARQRAYVRAMGLRGPYTPQMVIDGRLDVVGSDRGRVLPQLASRPQVLDVSLTRKGPDLVAALGSGTGEGEVTAFTVQAQARTLARRGENAGRILAEAQIVRSIHPLGRWRGAEGQFSLPLADIPKDVSQVIVTVQRDGPGAMLGAARMDLP
jgi:hypothetical protein